MKRSFFPFSRTGCCHYKKGCTRYKVVFLYIRRKIIKSSEVLIRKEVFLFPSTYRSFHTSEARRQQAYISPCLTKIYKVKPTATGSIKETKKNILQSPKKPTLAYNFQRRTNKEAECASFSHQRRFFWVLVAGGRCSKESKDISEIWRWYLDQR